MSLRFLLDTNIVSEPLRPLPDARILKRLQRHQGGMAIASVVWHELWYGCRRLQPSVKRATIERYLLDVVAPSLPVLPYDELAADWHATERARLSRAGMTPPFADGQIISIARVHELTLVTLNPADYASFQDVEIATWQ